jgi:hypothetical protein
MGGDSASRACYTVTPLVPQSRSGRTHDGERRALRLRYDAAVFKEMAFSSNRREADDA